MRERGRVKKNTFKKKKKKERERKKNCEQEVQNEE